MSLTIKPGHGWHRLLARMVTGEPDTLNALVKEARALDPTSSRRRISSKIASAAKGLTALGLVEPRGPRLHPTPSAAAELARLDALAREDA